MQNALSSSLKKLKSKKLRGITIIEILIVITIMLIITVAGVGTYSSSINKAKMALLLNDFASLKAACTQMLYEKAGMTEGTVTEAMFYEHFNQYVDSNSALKDDNKTLLKNDPWGEPYTFEFEQISKAETKITVNSTGKSDKVEFAMLIHYKNGEVRVGTAGFDNNDGADTSDAEVVAGIAVITDMWAK